MNSTQTAYRRAAARVLAFAFGLLLLSACTNPFRPADAMWQAKPGELYFEAAGPATQTLQLGNAGGSWARFEVSTSSTWIHASPTAGRLGPGETISLQVSVDTCGNEGPRSGTLEVSGSGGRATVHIIQACAPEPGGPTWALTPVALSFDAVVGGAAPAPQTLQLRNTGTASGSFTASSDRGWLSVSPASGTIEPDDSLDLRVDAAACSQPGSDTATLRFLGDGAEAVVTAVRDCMDPQNHPPTADLTVAPSSGTAPLTVTFTPSTQDLDGDPVVCSLDFGDNQQYSGTCKTSVEHTYATSGSYTAVLSARDGRGGYAEARRTVEVASPNQPPTASLTAQPSRGEAPLGVSFTLEARDPDGDILNCVLDFGDGASTQLCSSPQSHTYTSAGSYTATLRVRDAEGAEATASATLQVSVPAATSEFTIDLLFVHEPDPAVRAAFESAAAHWQRVITGDLRDVTVNIPAGSCIEGNPGFQGSIDDLLVVADVGPIDGVYGILGSAGPCYVRGEAGTPGDDLPYFGAMRFDEADLARMQQDGTLETVILHEMGHVLGLGTLWEAGPFSYLNHDAASCQDSTQVTYTGTHGVDAYHALGRLGEVPVENTGGAGTKCGHWQEATFGDELMTGWINGANAPLSRVTVGGLDDLGYRVDYSQADAYVLPSSQAGTLGAGEPLGEILIYPAPPDPR